MQVSFCRRFEARPSGYSDPARSEGTRCLGHGSETRRHWMSLSITSPLKILDVDSDDVRRIQDDIDAVYRRGSNSDSFFDLLNDTGQNHPRHKVSLSGPV